MEALLQAYSVVALLKVAAPVHVACRLFTNCLAAAVAVGARLRAWSAGRYDQAKPSWAAWGFQGSVVW